MYIVRTDPNFVLMHLAYHKVLLGASTGNFHQLILGNLQGFIIFDHTHSSVSLNGQGSLTNNWLHLTQKIPPVPEMQPYKDRETVSTASQDSCHAHGTLGLNLPTFPYPMHPLC